MCLAPVVRLYESLRYLSTALFSSFLLPRLYPSLILCSPRYVLYLLSFNIFLLSFYLPVLPFSRPFAPTIQATSPPPASSPPMSTPSALPLLSSLFPHSPPNSNKFRIHPFKLLKEPPKKPNPQSRIKTPGRRPYTMHTQLRDTRINRPYPRHSAEHRPHGAAAAGIVADLEDLEC